jgi:hypothetical protein
MSKSPAGPEGTAGCRCIDGSGICSTESEAVGGVISEKIKRI